MTKKRIPIRTLDDQTINKIAAGEVVERPASALKELLENSADGGARRIEVFIEEGGRKLLKVRDDGAGIPEEELLLALSRHATSKLSSISDLQSIETFGFRGEALSSIGAVSRLTLSSTTPGALKGAEIASVGGALGEVRPQSPIEGTTVVVEDLFFNVPARQKFLKSQGAETAAIKKTVKAFALAHPEIQIQLTIDGKLVYNFPACDFVTRAHQVLELRANQTIHIKKRLEDCELEAVLSRPELSQSTQQNLWLLVQGRPVQDRSISHAIVEGYRHVLMEHQFPQGVLSLRVSPETIDVNVHPAKTQVKFVNPQSVFRFVHVSINEALEKELGSKKQNISQGAESFFEQPTLMSENRVQYAVKQFNLEQMSPMSSNANQDVSPWFEPKKESSQNVGAWESLQVIGQVANTYIVTQSPKALVLVDQHAAHERVMFERLMRDFKNSRVDSQVALLAETLELGEEASENLCEDEASALLQRLGFEIIRRGPSAIAVVSRPTLLQDMGLGPMLSRVSEQISDGRGAQELNKVVGDIVATMACHGAIRAGKVLSPEEMASLLKQMDEFAFSSFCPHGRPVSVSLSLHDLEKLFKRIV
ncbi:MAG: DNA mismatch repair endonuclease MutL [Oligoflexia bacterium]|nr:DNA mismatch repair endonuclease MutL [Oligoflexia bacterium]